ncbi:MAG: hypothetical protein H0W48_00335 [Methylibium sp.]|nr:hypothetical protein [Methylibium sp.]
MKVKELIALLQQCPPDEDVSVWNDYHDHLDLNVVVSRASSTVHVGTQGLPPKGNKPGSKGDEGLAVMSDSTLLRDICAHKAAVAAMWRYSAAYANQRLGCMGFWDGLEDYRKMLCLKMVEQIEQAPPRRVVMDDYCRHMFRPDTVAQALPPAESRPKEGTAAMRIDGDCFFLEDGQNYLDVNCGIAGIDADLSVYYGADGCLFDKEGVGEGPFLGTYGSKDRLSKAERLWFADQMIARWQAFRALAEKDDPSSSG